MNNNKVSRIITCALPYANGELHLGHVASTYLPADIFVKYLKLKG
ncbi:MAG: class I tRNA ligase family protein, partial [Candidatus Aenigmatarchaeota archaeon]